MTTKNTTTAKTKAAAKAPKAKTARINLDVPFTKKEYAKKCGAYWDPNRGVWYTYAGAHGAKALAPFMGSADRKAYGKAYGFAMAAAK